MHRGTQLQYSSASPNRSPIAALSPCCEGFSVLKNSFLNSKATGRSEQVNRYGHLTLGAGRLWERGGRCDGEAEGAKVAEAHLRQGGNCPCWAPGRGEGQEEGARARGWQLQVEGTKADREFIQGWGRVNVISKQLM